MFRKLFDHWRIPSAVEVISHDFDPVFYRRLHPELTEYSDEDLSAHYCEEGWQLGYDPAQDFSTLRYLEAYEDVAAAQICLLYTSPSPRD